MEWVLIKTLFSLVAVLGLMLGVVFLLKKFAIGGSFIAKDQVEVTLLGSKSLQQKKTIQVIRVMDRIFVLGLSEAGIEKIAEFDNAGDGARLEPVPAREPVLKKPFLAHLSGSIAALVPGRPNARKSVVIQRAGAPTRRRETKTV